MGGAFAAVRFGVFGVLVVLGAALARCPRFGVFGDFNALTTVVRFRFGVLGDRMGSAAFLGDFRCRDLDSGVV